MWFFGQRTQLDDRAVNWHMAGNYMTTSIFSRTRRAISAELAQDIKNLAISRAKRSSTRKATSEPTRSGLHAAGPAAHWPRLRLRPHFAHARSIAERAGADVNCSRERTTRAKQFRRLRSGIHLDRSCAGSP